MSLKVMAWAWTVQLPPTPKLVLMALSDEADDRGYCFPSHRRLADKCSIAERSVRRMLSLLVELERIIVERRFKKDGGRTSNGYRILFETPRTNCPGGPDTVVRGEGTALSGGIGHACPGAQDTDVRVTTTYPCIYPNTLPGPPSAQRVHSGNPQPEDLCFPKALSEVQKQALRKELQNLNQQQAQQVLDELVGRMRTAKVHHPIRYCAALVARLQRGEFHPGLGTEVGKQREAERQRDAQPRESMKPSEKTASKETNGFPEDLRRWLRPSRLKFGMPGASSVGHVDQPSPTAEDSGDAGTG